MDEMYIKQDLVYDKHTGEIVGFTNLGDINNHLIQLERACLSAEESSNEPLARTVMVFMVKGLFQHLAFPFAHFPCANVTADLLIDPFWEAVYRLEKAGLKVWKDYRQQESITFLIYVLGATFDGASINRRFVKLHSRNNELIHKILNPYSTEARQFYFFFDPPHLLKTTRNCWASKARNLWVNFAALKVSSVFS